MHAPSAPGHEWPSSKTPNHNPWLDHLGRGMWVRAHLSTFALGSVILLAINLLRGSGGVWADTAIGAWGVLVMAHGILLLIARLLQELLAEDEEQPIRPASEIHWAPSSTWSLPSRGQEQPPTRDKARAPEPPPQPTPTVDPADAAAAAAAREGSRRRPAKPETTDEPERVSWKAATDAAWLAPREAPSSPKDTNANDDDENDFTPLKFD